jgi:uncharacterized protein (DUF433 family)
MRWPVEVILDMLGSGMETSEILDDHPELEREDILASLIMPNYRFQAIS